VGDDRLRPLSKKGRVQAAALPATVLGLTGGAPPRLVSSPWVRCLETVAPLAERIGGEVVADDTLGEGMGAKAVESLAAWMREDPLVLCTHGDVIESILAELAKSGVRLRARKQASKGSLWVLTGSGDAIDAARYVPPPA